MAAKPSPPIDLDAQEAKRVERARKRDGRRVVQESLNERFKKYSTRGVALLVAARLDRDLRKAILRVLVDDKEVSTMMLNEQGGALGSFGARIRMAYLLGLYPEYVYKDLMAISKIRNDFAHDVDISDFSHTGLKEALEKLESVAFLRLAMKDEDLLKDPNSILNWFKHKGMDEEEPTYQFMQVCILLGIYTNLVAENITRLGFTENSKTLSEDSSAPVDAPPEQ